MRREQVNSASSGQTEMTTGKVDYHFVCFLEDPAEAETILEFDGCKWEAKGPGRHKTTGGD